MRVFGDCIRLARRLAGLAAGTIALSLIGMSGGCFAGQQAAPQAAQARESGQPVVSMEQLMQLLAQRKRGTVAYSEKDYLAILDRPVKSSGLLVYEAPDRLEKRTLKPKQESLVLEGDELTVQRGHRTYRMQLSAYPQVAPLVAAIRDTLAGNEGALEKVFRVGLTGTVADWKLQLAPLDRNIARHVKLVEMAGARDAIRSVEILQVDGDRSVMTLGAPTDPSGVSESDATGDHE